MKHDYLYDLRNGNDLSLGKQISLILSLSLPSIFAQVSTIIMEYVDASMVGRLGANDSASIGLISSSTWLFNGLSAAIVTGFSVQVAQRIGAREEDTARGLMKQAFVFVLAFATFFSVLGVSISKLLPVWLGGNADIIDGASKYFLIYAATIPISQINNLSASMLQASGDMKIPSILHIIMCILNVFFNTILIFPSNTIPGIPGAGLGVVGAALGTSLSQTVIMLLMLYFLLIRSPMLKLRKGEGLKFNRDHILTAIKIAIPVGLESLISTGAQVVSTRIVAPLGTIPIAANSFGVTAESLCYMPGYGIAAASATIIGQSVGAKRRKLAQRLGWLTTILGMLIMTVGGVLLYIFAPFMIGILSPDPEIIALGASVLRIEAFAEPLFAASIVVSGVCRGAGDTLIPSCINFITMWAVRLPIAAVLAPRIGLQGVWIGMAVQLCVCGAVFLIRLARGKWLYANGNNTYSE